MRVRPSSRDSTPGKSESELIAAAKRNSQAFGPLYERYHEPIFRYIYQRLNSKDDAFDIVQQTFLKAMQNLHRYEDRGLPFSAWLYRIAANELNDFFRANKNKRTVNATTDGIEGMLDEMAYDHERDERVKLLLSTIADLIDEELNLIDMRFFEKRAFKEIADILEITENNAKVRTYRLLDKLKTRMLKNLPDHE